MRYLTLSKQEFLKKTSATIQVPQFGDVECLNAAASASITIYDWVRKEQTKPLNSIEGYKFK